MLRYWEQEFTQLKPVKRRGNRRYYQHHEVLLIRRIRELLYEQGFTIHGARARLGQGFVNLMPVASLSSSIDLASLRERDPGCAGVAPLLSFLFFQFHRLQDVGKALADIR